MATMATRGDTKAKTASSEFTCPECGKTFSRAQALGAHRRQAHGVAGTSRKAPAKATRRTRTATRAAAAAAPTGRRTRRVTQRPRSSSDGSSAAVNRDALLKALVPAGIPPRQDVIAAVNEWLAEGERLARLR